MKAHELLDDLLADRVEAVPAALDLLERDPLVSGGRFPGDLLRALMDVPSAYWVRNPAQYSRYRAAVRSGAEQRRTLPPAERLAFWAQAEADPSRR